MSVVSRNRLQQLKARIAEAAAADTQRRMQEVYRQQAAAVLQQLASSSGVAGVGVRRVPRLV